MYQQMLAAGNYNSAAECDPLLALARDEFEAEVTREEYEKKVTQEEYMAKLSLPDATGIVTD